MSPYRSNLNPRRNLRAPNLNEMLGHAVKPRAEPRMSMSGTECRHTANFQRSGTPFPTLKVYTETSKMSTSPLTLLSENKYLHTSFRPDCDYVDGFILERNLGQHDHARLQGLILYWLMQHEKQWHIHALPECRLKIRSRKYRVPDVMVLPIATFYPPVIEQPPLLCIEIVSPDDHLADLAIRADDYLTLGVPVTWIFDPETKQSFVYSNEGTVESVSPILFHGQIELPIAELYAKL